MAQVLLTLAVGLGCGYLFFRLKFPGGLIVGAIIGVAALNIGFEAASFPTAARSLAQITAGSFIGCSVSKADLKNLPRILRPLLILVAGYIVLNLTVGMVVYHISSMDLVTSFMCCVPGGMTDIPIIAADMDANVPYVAVMQFIRMAVGVGFFPLLIAKVADPAAYAPEPAPAPEAAAPVPETAAPVSAAKEEKDKDKGPAVILVTVAVGTAFGLLGKKLGIPAGIILFSTVSVLIFKLVFGRAYIPRWLKRAAQVMTGCYIGTCFGRKELTELRLLILPAALLLLGYVLNCFFMGWLLPKVTHLNRAEAMLIATPAGASDMALISSDVGVDSPDVCFIQILRMIIVVTVFPHIINLAVWLAG